MGDHSSRIVDVLAVLLVTVLLGTNCATAETPVMSFSPPLKVSKSPGFSQAAAIALDPGGGIYIAWEDRSVELPLFSRSLDGGATFTGPAPLAPAVDVYSYGQLRLASAHPGEVRAAFTVFNTDPLYGGWADVAYTASNDGGATFSTPLFVSEADSFNSIAPAIATGWTTAISWYETDMSTGKSAVKYVQSVDGGSIFTLPKRLDRSQGQVGCSAVALGGEGTVYTAWVQNDDSFGAMEAWEVFFSRSIDHGTTFSLPVNISSYPEHSWCPRMAVDKMGTIFLVWAEGSYGTDMKLLFTRSRDGGSSFDNPRVLIGPLPSLEPEPSLAANGDGNLWISWFTGNLTTTMDGFITRSTDSGATFSPAIPLPGAGGVIASTGSNIIHAIWNEVSQGMSSSDIFYSRGIAKPGDCDTNGTVTIAEVQSAINMFLGLKAATGCVDNSGDSSVSIAEVQKVINGFLGL